MAAGADKKPSGMCMGAGEYNMDDSSILLIL